MTLSAEQREEIKLAAREYAATSAREQGLPEKITDPRVIADIVAVIRNVQTEAA